MPYTRYDAALDEVDAATRAVEAAELKYHKGGSVDAVNKANRRLADAHVDYYECVGGRIPEHRRR